jgi:hypothetical protein
MDAPQSTDKKYFTCGPTELYPVVREYMLEALDKKLPSISQKQRFRNNCEIHCR